jgi:hypothetical protein
VSVTEKHPGTDAEIDEGAEFRRLNGRRLKLGVEIRDLEQQQPVPRAAGDHRLRLLEARAELAAVEKEIADRWGPPGPLGASAPIETEADLNRRLAGITVDREALSAARKKATTMAELAQIDAKLKALDDEEIVLGNLRQHLAQKARAEQEARERARVAAEQEARNRCYLQADAIFGEILDGLDRLDALRRQSGLEDLAPIDFDTFVVRPRSWVQAFEQLDRWRYEVVHNFRRHAMPAVLQWAKEVGETSPQPPAPSPRRKLRRR